MRGNSQPTPGGAAGRATPQGNLQRQPLRRRRMRGARQLETPSPAKPEDDPTGVTRRIISRRNWRASRGVTQSLSAGCAEGCDSSRRLEDPSPARPEDAETGSTPGTHREAQRAEEAQGNLGVQRQERRRMRSSRQLEVPSPAEPEDAARGATRSQVRRRHWKCVQRGRPWVRAPVALKDAGQEATQVSIAGRNLEMRARGNPNAHRKTKRVDVWAKQL